MKKLVSFILCLSLSVVALSGCGYTKKKDGLKLVEITTKDKSEPEVKIYDNLTIPVELLNDGTSAKSTVYVSEDGSGEEIKDGETLEIGYTVYSYPDKERIFSTWEDSDSKPQRYEVAQNTSDPNDIYPIIIGKHVGAVLVEAIPGQNPELAESAQGASQFDTTGKHFTIRVMQILNAKQIEKYATGASNSNLDQKLPKVTLGNDHAPAIETPANFKAPEDVVSEKLKTGTGQKVTQNSTLVLQYSGFTLDGAKFDSTWDRGRPIELDFSSIQEEWKPVLNGATVGSQYMIIMHASEQYSELTNNLIPPNSSVVFVVDVLDAY